jgi:hypothetical protein
VVCLSFDLAFSLSLSLSFSFEDLLCSLLLSLSFSLLSCLAAFFGGSTGETGRFRLLASLFGEGVAAVVMEEEVRGGEGGCEKDTPSSSSAEKIVVIGAPVPLLFSFSFSRTGMEKAEEGVEEELEAIDMTASIGEAKEFARRVGKEVEG